MFYNFIFVKHKNEQEEHLLIVKKSTKAISIKTRAYLRQMKLTSRQY